MVVLDTDHLSLVEWRAGTDARRLRTRLRGMEPGSVVSTIVSFEEQMRGWLAQLAKARTIAQQIDAYGRLLRSEGTVDVVVRANWRIVFRLDAGDAHDVDLIDYH